MARHLLAYLTMAFASTTWLVPSALAAGATGCVFPPPLELDESDAGPNSPPVIESASPAEFAFPGIMVLDRGDQRRISLTLTDTDVDDTLFIRMFVDYGLPDEVAFRVDCVASPSGMASRVADCSTATLCGQLDPGDTEQHFLEAMVADRKFLTESDPLAADQPSFRALPPSASSSFRSWIMRCNPET